METTRPVNFFTKSQLQEILNDMEMLENTSQYGNKVYLDVTYSPSSHGRILRGSDNEMIFAPSDYGNSY